MRNMLNTIISALLISSLCAGAVFAAEFDPSLDVDTSKEGKIIVSINDKNDGVLAEKNPVLTIPCDFVDAYVEFDGETVSSVLENGGIAFTVASGGEYIIIEKDAADTPEDNEQNSSGNSNNRSNRRPSSGKKEEVTEKETSEISAKEQKQITLTIDSTIVLVNGESMVNDVAPVIRDSRTFLPIRIVAEELGADVAWGEAEQTVTIKKDDLEIVIYIGQLFAMANGEPVQLDAPAYIENDRTFLPVRFIAENLGADVAWNETDRTVSICSAE